MHADPLDPVEDAHALADSIREDWDHLQAIVDKLPKINELNDDGTVTQTCPVYPGMTVWVVQCFGKMRQGRVLSVAQRTVFVDWGEDAVPYRGDRLANTPEAAEAGR